MTALRIVGAIGSALGAMAALAAFFAVGWALFSGVFPLHGALGVFVGTFALCLSMTLAILATGLASALADPNP